MRRSDNFTAYGRSDVGLVRKNNEDSVFVDNDRGLLVVADGMGGHAAGEVASRITVEKISERLPGASFWWPFGRAARERRLLVSAIQAANESVRAAAAADHSRLGMGTTVVVLWMRTDGAHVAHVGDSRIYRFRRGGLVQLTRDHAWPDEHGGMRNALTRAIGAEDDVEVDYRLVDAAPGDIFLLCSDGLTRTVDDREILSALSEERAGAEAVEDLIGLALKRGAPDNVTVILGYS